MLSYKNLQHKNIEVLPISKSTTTSKKFQWDIFKNSGIRKIYPDFNCVNVRNDGGVLLLRQTDERIRLTERVPEISAEYDNRRQGSIRYKKKLLSGSFICRQEFLLNNP
jgi:hypothetical protein